MGLPVEVNNLLLGGARDYTIARSLRFRSSATAYLNRTPASTGNRQKFTYSVWVKRGALATGTYYQLFGAGPTSGTNEGLFFDTTSGGLYFTPDGSTVIVTSSVYRDPSAWYHIVLAVDTTQATAANREIIYVNGVQVTSYTGTYCAQNTNFNYINVASVQHRIGAHLSAGFYFDGYLAEVNFINDQALTPVSFGAYDTNGIWQPKKYVGTYGTNGFYLNFSDNSAATAAAIGKDSSGLGNNWTPNNISLTAGTTYDSMIDSPTVSLGSSNYATWNSAYPSVSGILNANLSGSSGAVFVSTIGMSSGKWYAEFTTGATSAASGYPVFGVHSNTSGGPVTGYPGSNSTNNSGFGIYNYQVGSVVYQVIDGVQTTVAGATNWAANDVIMFAFDADTGKVWAGKNGTWYVSGNPSAGTGQLGTISSARGVFYFGCGINDAGATSSVNFGQRPFTYTPPAGFNSLNTYNLPAATINNGAQNFAATLYTGNGGTQTVSNGNFQPDFVWIKNRAAAVNHQLQNSVAGWQYGLISNSTSAEYNDPNAITGATSTGWSMNNNYNSHNQTGINYVGWQWKAGSNSSKTYTVTVSGGVFYIDGKSNPVLQLAEGSTYIFDQSSGTNIGHPLKFSSTTPAITLYETGVTYNGTPGYSGAYTQITVASGAPTLYYVCTVHGAGMGNTANTNSTTGASNFAGSINSVVNVNTTAGFSIVTYTETSGSYTVGHSLGVAPSMIIVRERNAVSNWVVWQNYWTAPTKNGVYLNGTAAAFTTGSNWLNSTSSTTFGITAGQVTAGTANIVAYCFAAVRGYSAFGSYTGNGSADGPFVFTGHRPRWLMWKASSTTGQWFIHDTARSTYNYSDLELAADSTAAEYSANGAGAGQRFDILSNGFKARTSNAANNGSGTTYIYAAFAENPFNISRAR